MRIITISLSLAAACVLVATTSAQAQKDPVPTREQAEFFNAKIRPVLFDTCGECHIDDENGGLRTDSRESLIKGGENGPAIVPGDPEASLLIHAIRRDGTGPRMPKEGPRLSQETIDAFTKWIKDGAPWPVDKLEWPPAR
jgi:mono/diheme cytochrome c family protein